MDALDLQHTPPSERPALINTYLVAFNCRPGAIVNTATTPIHKELRTLVRSKADNDNYSTRSYNIMPTESTANFGTNFSFLGYFCGENHYRNLSKPRYVVSFWETVFQVRIYSFVCGAREKAVSALAADALKKARVYQEALEPLGYNIQARITRVPAGGSTVEELVRAIDPPRFNHSEGRPEPVPWWRLFG